MALTLTTENKIARAAGYGANDSLVLSSSILVECGEEAEGELVADTRRDWVTGYSNVNAFVKNKISNAVAAKAAIKIIRYDGGGYFSRLEQETIIDILTDDYLNAVKVLSDLDANNIRSVND